MCANWAGNNRESPERNNRYQLDSVGLQIGLGLPLQLLGVSLMNDFNNGPGQNENGGYRKNHQPNHSRKVEIKQTCDGIPIRKLYVTNISIEADRSEMREIFGRFGYINQIYMGISKNDNRKQFAFITFFDPLAAARVLSQQRFPDGRGRMIYVMEADSWHQPRELPDGKIDWKTSRTTAAKQEEESEEEEEQTGEETDQIDTEVINGSVNMLNDDCMLHIFSFMTLKEVAAVERVCKRWQALSFRMWRYLHVLDFDKDRQFSRTPCNTKLLDQYLKRCGPSLTTLNLTAEYHYFNEITLAVVAKHCENLKVLQVSNITVGNRCLAHLGRSCRRLTHLVMDGCDKVTDGDMNALLPKCPDLTGLELSNITPLTGKCLVNVQGPITRLCLRNLSKLEPAYLIKGLQKMSATLESLSLHSCGPIIRHTRDIVALVPNLTSFTMSQCMIQIDNRALSPIGELKKLTSLDLFSNNAVNDTTLSAIVSGCEELTSLNLGGSGGGCAGALSERGLSSLAHLPKLTHLNISYLEATNSTALKNFTTRNSRLKSLVCRGCPELNDEGIETVVSLCNELELLDVSGCNLTNRTMETAIASVKIRTNNTPLCIILGGTQIDCSTLKELSPLLTVDFKDLSEEHLRPDFMDDMFFPPSDSDDDDDLDHLCERIGCDCDFEFDDLFDPTLVNDETRRFGLDSDEDFWVDDTDDYCDVAEQWEM